MRTTIDIPNTLYRELRSRAAKEGRSVKELILGSVQEKLKAGDRRSCRVSLPIIVSRPLGTLTLDDAKIFEIIPFP